MITVEEIHANLRGFLERKAVAVRMTGNSGGYAIAQFSAAKEVCLEAGLTQDDIQAVIDGVAERRRA